MSTRGKAFWRNQSGATAALYALALPPLVAIGGVGFDYARLAGMDSELQNAADQAALAGATQLDGKAAVGTTPGACQRAISAAQALVVNKTRLSSDVGEAGKTTDVAVTTIVFYATRADAEAGTNRILATATTCASTARFVGVEVQQRTVDYALTPVTGVLYGDIVAAAAAGVGSSICKVPPLMICSPDPSQPFNAAGKKGWGIQATGHGGGTASWGPGAFGFLEVGDGSLATLEKALAFVSNTYDCTPIEGTRPETGNAQGLYRAINTRFDIYDTNGQPLNDCLPDGKCPAASNVVKDLVKADTSTTGNACKTHNQGWKLPTNQFSPAVRNPVAESLSTQHDAGGADAMGLPRDLCHYSSYVGGLLANQCHSQNGLSTDTDNRYGTGKWARRDYFNVNHPTVTFPPAVGSQYLIDSSDPASFTRFGVYKWELAQNNMPHGTAAGSAGNQYGKPVCSTGSVGTVDRRVLTVAIVKNCASLSGGSTNVQVDEWVDVFLVEPTIDSRGNGAVSDSIYVEVIGPASVGDSTGGAAQTIRRDVPYLVR